PRRIRRIAKAPSPMKGAGMPSLAPAPDSARIMSWSIMFVQAFRQVTAPSSHSRARVPSPTCPMGVVSRADVPLPDHEPLRGGDLGEPHGAAGVELLGGDADLGAEAELAAVGEAGGGVGHHHGRVDLG